MSITQKLKKRFWDKVDKSGDCWEWTAFKNDGYGWFRIGGRANGRSVGAHRVSWMLANGEIPDGGLICHKCDNRSCVNPDHLYVGTVMDNMRDRMTRGDGYKSNKQASRVREGDLDRMRDLRRFGLTYKEIGEWLNWDKTTVHKYVTGVLHVHN